MIHRHTNDSALWGSENPSAHNLRNGRQVKWGGGKDRERGGRGGTMVLLGDKDLCIMGRMELEIGLLSGLFKGLQGEEKKWDQKGKERPAPQIAQRRREREYGSPYGNRLAFGRMTFTSTERKSQPNIRRERNVKSYAALRTSTHQTKPKKGVQPSIGLRRGARTMGCVPEGKRRNSQENEAGQRQGD